MPRTFGSLSAYEPGLMDQARWWLQDKLTPVMGGDARRAGDFVQNKVMPTAEYLPGVGDAMAAGEAVDYFKQGQPIFGTLAAAGAMAGLVPGVGDAVQKGVKKAAKGIRSGSSGLSEADYAALKASRGQQAPAPAPSVEYRGVHQAPTRTDDGTTAPLHQLDVLYPDDVYSGMAVQYYGTGDNQLDRETMRILQSVRGNPDATVTVYRAVPKGVKDINPGDWVTPNKNYARSHGQSWVDDGQYDIIEKQIRAGDLYTDANSIHEFGYSPQPPKPQGIRAYHGSPHDFDKFSLDKIGTGEGAQAYGHGLYFAESEGVAKSYRDNLTNHALDWAQRTLAQTGNDVDKAISVLERDLLRKTNSAEALQYKEAALRELRHLKQTGNINTGRMYEVNINADPNDFLDWDKPLSEQPEKIVDVIADIAAENGITMGNATGARALEDIAKIRTARDTGKLRLGDKEATEMLRNRGIPGIKYLDAGSRYNPASLPDNPIANEARQFLEQAGGDTDAALNAFRASNPVERFATSERAEVEKVIRAAGRSETRNYVVFDDALIEILRKYGLAGLGIGVGAGGFGSLAPQDDNYQPPQL